MDVVDFINRYTDEVYLARDPSAAARFIADPCLRHEQGELIVMSLADNQARIAAFLAQVGDGAFSVDARLVVADGEHVASCYELAFGGHVLSGIEVFRIVDGLITETWNSAAKPGAWG